ncbi:MAG: UDP-N-acetylmuramoyl-L-alanyl-D-glutamate--2,6-diaminopimelate ligase [Oscillospiraceae bacterium]|nr:UDP-N-acetylmuramoyl-L-alanyl-D-glutamate--2,6-diaminopimelate ligase [Oscillospiraceae bacterium]
MTLGELFGGVAEISAEISDTSVTDVTSDSREVQEGSVFVCIKGMSFDGHSVAAQMLEKGACAVVTQERLGLSREINVENSRRLYPELLSKFFGRPTESIKLGAVTGTNGKSTVVNLCIQIIRSLGEQAGVIGTLGTDTGKGLQYSHSGPPTTPEPKRLYGLFREMADIGTKYCFIEASSQALAQYRFAAEHFTAGAFTNLTQDHLDYHKTMENYYAAKRSLFDMCENAVINIDDEYGRQTAQYCHANGIPCDTVSVFGTADYYTETVTLNPDSAEFFLTDRAAEKCYPVKLPMTGYYNVSNAIQAAVMCSKMGFPLWKCLEALSHTTGVSGRLETLYSGDYTVVCDYAHTDDGLTKLLSTLKPLAKNRLITVFGAAGDRDSEKRPKMGKAAEEWSDLLVITTDNPANEDPQQTIDGVKSGLSGRVPYVEFTDRTEAVIYALETAQAGDVIALCGKGHEDYQIIGREYVHFSEKEIVQKYLAEKGLI